MTTDSSLVPEHSVAQGTDEAAPLPRSDLKDAVGWIAFGIAVLVGSITMDRLEQQHINPVTVPGLLPGLLGIAMILLGGVLGVRSLRRGALARALPPATAHQREERKRVAIATLLCAGTASCWSATASRSGSRPPSTSPLPSWRSSG